MILEQRDSGAYVVLAHLRRGSIQVREGASVVAGQQVAACGNSGNSTQPHLHLQVMSSPDPFSANGLPISFRDYRVWRRRSGPPVVVALGIPDESDVVEPL